MAIQSPIVLASGFFSQLFPGDTVPGTDTTAQASGNAALVRANTALASGNAGISTGLTALASGNAGLVSASNKVPISGGYMTGQLFAASGVVVSGTLSRNGFNVVTVGDVETVTSTMIASGTIIDADVNISGAINATKLNFLQAGASAVARTVDSKLKDTVSVKDFGAVGDGVTDDTAAIVAAIAACQNSSKTSLFFPTGIYRIQSTITLATLGIAFLGESAVPQTGSAPPAVVFRWHGGAAPMFDVQTSFFHFYNISFENFTTATEALLLTDAQHMLFERCSFVVGNAATRFSSAAIRTLGNEFGYSVVRNCEIVNPAPRFLSIDGQGTGNGITPILFDNNVVESNSLGALTLVYIKDENLDSLTFKANTFNGQVNQQLTIVDTTDTPTSETIAVLNFYDNEIDLVANTATDRCFRLTNVTNINFWGNQVQGGGSATAIANLVNSTVTLFTGNNASSINGPFFSCDAASRVFPGHNRFNNSNTSGLATNPGSGKAGGVLQVVTASYSTQTSLGTSYANLVSVSITPTIRSSKLLVFASVNGLAVTSSTRTISLNICRDASQLIEFEKEAGYSGAVTTELAVGGASATWMDAPDSTSSLTYKIQGKANASPGAIALISGGAATITVMELAA